MFFSLPQFSREPHPLTFLNADPTILFPNLGSKAMRSDEFSTDL